MSALTKWNLFRSRSELEAWESHIRWSPFREMEGLRLFNIPLFAAIMFFAVPSAKAQPTTYTWVPADGNPYHISASIVLSAPSGSADQFYRDFFPDSFLQYDIQVSYEGYHVQYGGDAAGMFPGFLSPSYHITWDDSTITSLFGLPGYGDLAVRQNSITDYNWPPNQTDNSPIYASGSWRHLTPVPEGGNTMAYLIAALFPLFGAASFVTSRRTRNTLARRFG